MKRFRFLLLVLMLLVCSSAMWAHDFEVDGIYYNITSSENKTVEVTFMGEYYFYYNEYTGAVTIPETVTYGEVLYNVTSIGGAAFAECSGLTSITIPEDVTSIGNLAFYACSGLTSITIPEGVTSIGESAFNSCSGLTSITLPKDLTSIGYNAFYGCYGLTSITIPEDVNSIGESAFRGCSGLSSIIIPEGVTSIEAGAFDSCSGLTSITIPKSVEQIQHAAFAGCSSLTSIVVEEGNEFYDSRNNCNAIIETETNSLIVGCKQTLIPNSVTSIGLNAFDGCSNLTSITIPSSVTSIGTYAFADCSGLTSITIPNSVEQIQPNIFSGCSNLTSIVVERGNKYYDSRDNCNAIIKTKTNSLIAGCKQTLIPNSVTSIEVGAFDGCSSLTSITLPEGLTSIGNGAFYNCSGLTSITIPNKVTSIGKHAFFGCCDLTSITFPDGVTSIGAYAFSDCSGLTSITIPDRVSSIGEWTFMDCSALTSITFPKGLTSIGYHAFYGCSSLQSVKMLTTTPPAVPENIFDYCPENLVIYVPAGAAANYDVAPWNNYQIVEKSCMEDYAIWASDMRTRPTKPITLSVQLNNVNAISDYQFDLTLPKGFSVAMDEDDLEMIYLSTERTTERKHTYSYNMLSDSVLRVISYSNSTYTFSGNEGEVLTITLDVAEDVADGDYTLLIKNIEMTEPNGATHMASDYPCKVTIISYTPGDTNNDGNFSVTDVRGIVNMVLAAQVPDDNLAGDVNEDGVISVTDVRGVVNLVLNPVTPTKQLSSKMRSATSSANLLYIEPFTIAPGEEKEVRVMLNNPDDAFSDIQFDLYLPEGIEVVNDNDGYLIGLGSRTDLRNHNCPEAALQRDGAVRVLCYSDKAETFFGHSGDVIRLTLKASDTLSLGIYSLGLKNVELARPDMTNDRLQASTASVSVNGYATGIGSLEAEMERGEVYDLNGRPVQQPAKGVYIINGKKVIIK